MDPTNRAIKGFYCISDPRVYWRWIKSIGLLFLLHNAGSVSVLTDPQIISGQAKLLWSW